MSSSSIQPWEFEALSWLTNNRNPSALATNWFQTTEEAIEAVKRLYAAGATLVRSVQYWMNRKGLRGRADHIPRD